MADDVDRTQARAEIEATYLAAASRKPAGPPPNGRCLYCNEPLADGRRWCDADCRDEWQADDMRRRSLR